MSLSDQNLCIFVLCIIVIYSFTDPSFLLSYECSKFASPCLIIWFWMHSRLHCRLCLNHFNVSFQFASQSNPTEQLRSAMTELTINPGEFDNLVMPLGDTFCQWLTEPEVINSAIALILEHSIMEPNFRYNGARLCNLLNNLDNTEDGSAFRNILLERYVDCCCWVKAAF